MLEVCKRLGEGTFAGTRGNDKVAPISVARLTTIGRLKSTHNRRSRRPTASGADAALPSLTEQPGGRVRSGPTSNTLWATFDNTESRLSGRERHVVGYYRLGEALEGERAHLFGCNACLERDIDKLTEQNLAVLGLGA